MLGIEVRMRVAPLEGLVGRDAAADLALERGDIGGKPLDACGELAAQERKTGSGKLVLEAGLLGNGGVAAGNQFGKLPQSPPPGAGGRRES